MIATLRMEWIGHGTRRPAKAPLKQVLHHMRRIPLGRRSQLLSPDCRPWVARIDGRDPRHGLARTFLEGFTDYRDANGRGSRGVTLTYILYSGHLYEVHEFLSWTRTRRYFCRADAGKIVEITQADVQAHLNTSAGRIQDIINKASAR